MNIFASLAKQNLLQIIFFALIMGFALLKLGDKGKPLLDCCRAGQEVMKEITNMALEFTPYGVLDLLAISVQAGLSFDAALRKVVERMKGPLIDELSRMLRDVRMGMTRRRSMQFMAKRCDVQDVYLFVMSVTQSERLGASMSDYVCQQRLLRLYF